MMNGQQPQQVNLQQEISVTLTFVTWNTILSCIAKQPWEIADPLMAEIRKQVTAAVQATQPGANGPQPSA